MSGHSVQLVEHYRELAEGEVARAKFALTNEARPTTTRGRQNTCALLKLRKSLDFRKQPRLAEGDLPAVLSSGAAPLAEFSSCCARRWRQF